MLMMIMALAAAAGQVSTPAQPPQGKGQWGHGGGHGGPGGGPGGRGGPGGPGGPGGADRFFAMADTDHNGQISKPEFEAARSKMREHRMERREGGQRGGNGFGPMQKPGK